jgi:tRNA 2-thiouridine synthesizing protein A
VERSQSWIVTTVDARGLVCPMPLVLAKRAMAALAPGERLTVLATDREAPIDLRAWADEAGHGYRERTLDGWSEFTLTKERGDLR